MSFNLFNESSKVLRAVQAIAHKPALNAMKQVGNSFEKSVHASLRSDLANDIIGPQLSKEIREKLKDGKDVASTFSTSFGDQTIKQVLQSGADSSNEFFKKAGVDVKVLGPESPNWSKIKLVEELQERAERGDEELGFTAAQVSDQEGKEDSELGPHFSRAKAKHFVSIMKQARQDRGGDVLLQKYIDVSLQDAQFRRVSHLPSALERKLYYDIIRTSIQVFEICMLGIHNSDIIGHSVQVNLIHDLEPMGPNSKATRPLAQWTRMNENRVQRVVQEMMEDQRDLRKYDSLLPVVEKQFIITISQVTMRLLSDLFCDERIRVRALGHRVRWSFEPMSHEEIDKMIQARKKDRPRVNKKAIRLFVDELLKDEDLNIVWLPDIIEAEIYEHALTTVMCILEDTFASTDMTILGLKFNLGLVSAIEALPTPPGAVSLMADSTSMSGTSQQTQQQSSAQQQQHQPTLEELSEDKVSLLYASEGLIRKRLDAIYKESSVLESMLQQRELSVPLKGMKRLKSSDFRKTTSEVNKKKRSPEGSSDTDDNNVGSSSDSSDSTSQTESLADQTKREFQKLAAQESLARFLQVRKTLPNVKVDIPYTMIRDVETYVEWMPLCTGGEAVEVDPKTNESSVVKVSFGIDTKTFLGTLGDNVRYNITLDPPKKNNGFIQGRIVADTGSKGFAYGQRLIYDWVFIYNEKTKSTEVSLNLFIQLNGVIYLPIWDALQKSLTNNMMSAFEKHAHKVMEAQKLNPVPDSPTKDSSESPVPSDSKSDSDSSSSSDSDSDTSSESSSDSDSEAETKVSKSESDKGKSDGGKKK